MYNMRMKHCVIVTQFLVSVFCLYREAYSHGVFSKNSTIVHPETRHFLDYIGLYVSFDTIIHASAIFPMNTATYYFLPSTAVQIMPSCNITTKRMERFVHIISLCVGAVSLTMSRSNSIQISNLQQQVELAENSLSKLSEVVEIHETHLTTLTLKVLIV